MATEQEISDAFKDYWNAFLQGLAGKKEPAKGLEEMVRGQFNARIEQILDVKDPDLYGRAKSCFRLAGQELLQMFADPVSKEAFDRAAARLVEKHGTDQAGPACPHN